MSEQLERAGDALMSAARSLAYAWETDTSDRVMWDEWKKAQPAIDGWIAARRAEPAPVDWPARFRAAADAAEKAGYLPAAAQLREVSNSVALDVVGGIGRALLGEAP